MEMLIWGVNLPIAQPYPMRNSFEVAQVAYFGLYLRCFCSGDRGEGKKKGRRCSPGNIRGTLPTWVIVYVYSSPVMSVFRKGKKFSKLSYESWSAGLGVQRTLLDCWRGLRLRRLLQQHKPDWKIPQKSPKHFACLFYQTIWIKALFSYGMVWWSWGGLGVGGVHLESF